MYCFVVFVIPSAVSSDGFGPTSCGVAVAWQCAWELLSAKALIRFCALSLTSMSESESLSSESSFNPGWLHHTSPQDCERCSIHVLAWHVDAHVQWIDLKKWTRVICLNICKRFLSMHSLDKSTMAPLVPSIQLWSNDVMWTLLACQEQR